jgi:hypothetical protein
MSSEEIARYGSGQFGWHNAEILQTPARPGGGYSSGPGGESRAFTRGS